MELGNLGEEMGIHFVELGMDFMKQRAFFGRDGLDGGANTGGRTLYKGKRRQEIRRFNEIAWTR
jgi:hypothetical protein